MEVKTNATKKEIIEILETVDGEKSLLQNQVEGLKQEQAEKDALFAEQMKQMKEMQTMLMQLQSNALASTAQNDKKGLEEMVAVKSYLIGKHSVNIDKDSWITFGYTGAIEDLSVNDVKSMVKYRKNKELFINGIFIFEDEEDYKTFRIKPRRQLTDEYIIDLFKKEEVKDFLVELKDVTESKKIPSVMHNLVFRAGLLYKQGRLVNPSYDIMEAFKQYFGIGLLELNIQLLDEE